MWLPRILLLALSGLLVPDPVASQQPSEAEQGMFWRTAKNCGANCLYLMLHARGYDFTYEEILEATPIGPRGSTLADLKASAEKLGVSVIVGKGTPENLRTAALPVMIHMDPASGDSRASGHYLLVTGINHETGVVDVFDGTSALRTSISSNRLKRNWSGYVLEVQQTPEWVYKSLVTGLAFLVAIWIYKRRTTASLERG